MFYNINIVIADDHEIFLDGLSTHAIQAGRF